jgi:hypothetical protein
LNKHTARRRPGKRTPTGIHAASSKRKRPPRMTPAAAAAERASAGMGTEAKEPTEWLFGDSLLGPEPRPY